MNAGETIYVVVDGFSMAAGNYSVSATCLIVETLLMQMATDC